MNPSGKNWLLLFQEITENPSKSIKTVHGEEENTFSLLLNTGLLYGYPSGNMYFNYAELIEWSNADKIKIAYTECLYLCHKLNRHSTFNEFLEDTILFLSQTYFNTIGRGSSESNSLNLLEQLIDKRILNTNIFSKKHWFQSDYNTFAFADILEFDMWLNEEKCPLHFEEVVKNCIEASLGIDIATETAKQHLYSYFFKDDEFESPISLIEIVEAHPNRMRETIRNICYSFVVLSFLADKTIDEEETDLLKDVENELRLSKSAAYQIMLKTEEFVLANHNKLPYFSNSNGIKKLTNNVQDKFMSVLKKNRSSIISEIKESREAVELLIRWNSKTLSKEEKSKVRRQLMDILKTLPSLAIFMLPAGTLLLPLLLKILPEDLIKPSSFRNK